MHSMKTKMDTLILRRYLAEFLLAVEAHMPKDKNVIHLFVAHTHIIVLQVL